MRLDAPRSRGQAQPEAASVDSAEEPQGEPDGPRIDAGQSLYGGLVYNVRGNVLAVALLALGGWFFGPLTRAVARWSAGPRIPSPSDAPDMSGFHGREAELRALESTVRRGRRVIVIRGPMGIGKSLLAAAFGERARRRSRLPLLRPTFEGWSGSPVAPTRRPKWS